MSTTIEQLELEVSSNSTSAAGGIDELSSSLRRLREAVAPLSKGGMGLTSLSNSLSKFSDSISKLSGLSVAKENIEGLVSALKPLEGVQKSGFNSLATGLDKLAKVAPQIDKVTDSLKNTDLDSFANECNKVAAAITPLATQMEKVAAGFSAFPSKIQRLLSSNTKLSSSNGSLSLSYVNLAAKIGLAVTAVKRAANVVAGWITKSNQYIENLNLFTVSMGEYAGKAREYAESVGEIMGIDPGEFMRNQGIFMTLATGFGVVNDRAYTMSQNLTQLGYDLSSFFNISFEDSMQKLQSGLAGELEPLRRLGYDLSVARLQQEAYALGIEKKVTAMTQAEKAELRYYAIMTQVTSAQGDMARTLEAPANQLRILKAQVEQAARALGNIFIPALNAVLPYAIAVAKVIRMIANAIASIVGFTLPEIDYSGIGTAAGGAEDMANGLGDASDKAKKLKNALLGIDELNIISPSDDSSGSDSAIGGAGGLGFELPTYDFIGDAVTGRVDEIVNKMKEWLGLTGDIDSWSDFFHTKLGRILTTIGAIGVGLAAWKLSKTFLDGLSAIKDLKKNGLGKSLMLSAGVTLAVTGITLETTGIVDAIQNELNKMNFAQIVGGGGLIAGGGALIGKALGSAIIGGGIGGIVAGIPAFITGIYDSIKNGISKLSASLTALGATAAGAGIGAIIGACGGPIGAGIGALIGLAVGLVTDGIILVVQKWDVITEFLSNFFTVTIPGLWNRFISWVKNVGSELVNKVKEVASNVINGFKDSITAKYSIAKTCITAFATGVKNWFTNSSFGGVNGNTFSSYATNIVDGFKNRITNYYTAAKSSMETFASKVKSWFSAYASYDKFYSIASDVVEGFKDGVGALYQTCKNTINSWGASIISWFKAKLDSHSPSKVFMRIGEDTILGYNLGINALSDTTKGVVNKWADSFTSVSPVMSFAVDTSALRYYSSDSFAKSVSANVTTNSSVTATGFKEGMEEFYREYVEPMMAQMAEDMRRQADKKEQTVVQIGNRVVSDAVTTQQKANGYAFVR